MPRVWFCLRRELVFLGRCVAWIVVLLVTIGALGYSQNIIRFAETCTEQDPTGTAYWLCVQRADRRAFLANDTTYTQGSSEAPATPNMEATRAQDPDITGATDLTNAVKICRTGTTTCDDAVRIAFYCTASNVCTIAFYNASNALITEGKAIYAASSWLITIDTAGTQTTCLTMDDTGLMTYAALESCGRLTGLVHLEFAEDDGTHTCAAGNYGAWADTSETKLKVCQNGVVSDWVGAGGGTVDGSGASTHVTYWSDADTLTGEAAFTYNAGTNTLTADTVVVNTALTFGTTDPLKSIWISAGAMTISGTCTDTTPAERTIVTNGPKVLTIEPADGDTCSVEFDFVMPDAYNGGTITLEMAVFSTGNNSTEVFEMDCAGQAVSDGDPVGAHSTTGEQAANCVFGNQANDEQHCTTAAITIQGTPAAGDHLYMRCQTDATASTVSPFTDVRILGFKVEYGVGTMTD